MSGSAFQQGYDDSVAGIQPYPAKVEEHDRDTYMCGYRAAARGFILHEENKDLVRCPRTEIVLTINAASYLRHYNEMEGEPEDLANMLRHDAIKAVSEMDLATLAFELVVNQGEHDVITSVELRDRYDETEIEEMAETEQCPQAV